MDFNGDGKHDWHDDVILHDMINIAKENEDNTDTGSYSYRPTGKSSFEITQLGSIVIVLVVIICLFALFSGSAEIIGTLLGFGVIAFFIAQWLDS